MSLLQIYQWVCQWKNCENRLTFGEVMGKSLVSCFFWDTVYNVSWNLYKSYDWVWTTVVCTFWTIFHSWSDKHHSSNIVTVILTLCWGWVVRCGRCWTDWLLRQLCLISDDWTLRSAVTANWHGHGSCTTRSGEWSALQRHPRFTYFHYWDILVVSHLVRSVRVASSCRCPVQALGHNAPLIRFLILLLYTRWFIITGTPTKSGISLLLGHTCGYNLWM